MTTFIINSIDDAFDADNLDVRWQRVKQQIDLSIEKNMISEERIITSQVMLENTYDFLARLSRP